jgi:hypothetical protein
MARATNKTTVVSQNISKGSQDVIFSLLEKWPGAEGKTTKIKFEVRSDSYQFQCYAVASVWNENDLKWNRVHSIHHADMKTKNSLYYMPRPATAADFAYDVAELRRVVTEILA